MHCKLCKTRYFKQYCEVRKPRINNCNTYGTRNFPANLVAVKTAPVKFPREVNYIPRRQFSVVHLSNISHLRGINRVTSKFKASSRYLNVRSGQHLTYSRSFVLEDSLFTSEHNKYKPDWVFRVTVWGIPSINLPWTFSRFHVSCCCQEGHSSFLEVFLE